MTNCILTNIKFPPNLLYNVLLHRISDASFLLLPVSKMRLR